MSRTFPFFTSHLQYCESLSSEDNESARTDCDSTECSHTLVHDGNTSRVDRDRSTSTVGRCDLTEIANALPSLYPCYIAYEAQHQVLTTAQTVLEACCFDFAKQWLPALVQEQQWDCASAVELNRWTQFLNEQTLANLQLDTRVSELAMQTLLVEVRNLRDTAVYRIPTTARGISRLLQYATEFSKLLKDNKRAAIIGRIKAAVDDKIYILEVNKKVLESTANKKLHDIKERRSALKRQEAEIIADMLQLDLEKKTLVGRVLKYTIEELAESDRRQQQQ